jgi:basic membrane lipoprotein Med (substrate-binding protein (PBP1-ABC) superfamily)
MAQHGRPRGLSLRRRLLAAASVAALAALAAGLFAWQSLSGGGPAPRLRQYVESFTACLLTDSRGLAATQTALVWRGMQAASHATQAKVEYLPVMSGSTVAAADPYLTSLVERHCNVVVATGRAQVAAVDTQARKFPSVQFVVPGPAVAGTHVIGLQVPPGSLPSAVASVITAAVHRSS